MAEKFTSWGRGKTIHTITTILVIVFVIAILGVGLWWFFIFMIRGAVFEHETKLSIGHALVHADSRITSEEVLSNWRDAENVRHLEDFVRDVTMTGDVSNVNVFNQHGILVFSSEKREFGVFTGEEDVKRALEGEMVVNAVSKEEYAEDGEDSVQNSHFSKEGKLLEVYMPLSDSEGKTIGAVELYLDQTHIIMLTDSLQRWSVFFVGAAAVVIAAILWFIFRKQNERTIRQANEFSSIVNNAPIGICSVDRRGLIEAFNPKMAELLGNRHPQDVLGVSIFELLSCEDNNIDNLIRKGLQGQSFEIEIRDTCQTQNEKYRHYYGVPVHKANNEAVVHKLLLLVEDITERKRLALELEKYSKNLEVRVEERTRELEEKLSELSRLNNLMVNRELKMIELKNEIKSLEKK